MNEDRKQIIESFNYLPIEKLQLALDAKKNGASNNMCAAAAGMTHEDLMYMLELGAGGHHVWQEFFALWRRAEYLTTEQTWLNIKERAENGREGDINRFLTHHDAEFAARKQASEAPKNGDQKSLPGGIVVNIQRFENPSTPALQEVNPEVIDVEPS